VCYLLFGVLVYSAVYSFADVLIPLAFGARYATASVYARQMFLTILVFPTAFLQGNVLLAMKLERRDMWLNVVLLGLNGSICVAGLHYFPSLGVVNAALFLSFAIFHLLQDALLIRRGVATLRHALSFHITAAAFVLSYVLLARAISAHLAFPVYWAGLLLAVMLVKWNAPLRRHANLEWLAGTTAGETHA
jgi:O-antigen/teichoic acid export membrane protein